MAWFDTKGCLLLYHEHDRDRRWYFGFSHIDWVRHLLGTY